MSSVETNVTSHYSGTSSAREKLASFDESLRDLGVDPAHPTIEALAPLDQLHTRGPTATEAMADRLAPGPDDHVLDVGCGMGGPARHLAKSKGCKVTGIDLTPLFIEIARTLNTRLGLDDRVSFQTGSALDLPFDADSFDAAWTLHMSMNVQNKAGLYAEIFRVLKPGGRFALYDPVEGPAGDVAYPAPWANTPDTSFLLSVEGHRQAVEAAGFRTCDYSDLSADAMIWFTEMDRKNEAMSEEVKAKMAARRSPGFAEAMKNHRRNIAEGRIAIVTGVFEKPL